MGKTGKGGRTVMIYILTVFTETDLVGGDFEDTKEVEIPEETSKEDMNRIFAESARDIFFNRCNYGWHAKPKEDNKL